MGKNPDPGSEINIPDPQHCVFVLGFFPDPDKNLKADPDPDP
jgi:hypothetical protein